MDIVGFDMGKIKFRVEGLGLRVEFAGAKIGEVWVTGNVESKF